MKQTAVELPKVGTKEFNDSAMEMFGGKPKQQTAVEWLVDYIKNLEKYPYKTIQELEEQAIEMEKEQQYYSLEEVDFFVKNILHHIKCYEYNVNNLELISFSNDIEFEIEKLYEELKNK